MRKVKSKKGFWTSVFTAMIILLAYIFIYKQNVTISEDGNNDLPALTGSVVQIIDGDTYIINVDGKETKFRLIGIDTPESVAPSTYYKDNTTEGKEISELVKERIPVGTNLHIEYDVSKTDKYGRHLAYLYFNNGQMIQEWLLNEGYANVATYPPNVKYAERFAHLAHKAAENKVGLWNSFFKT